MTINHHYIDQININQDTILNHINQINLTIDHLIN